jgi:hypothetical protein
MEGTYLDLAREAVSICEFIQSQVAHLEDLEGQVAALDAAAAASAGNAVPTDDVPADSAVVPEGENVAGPSGISFQAGGKAKRKSPDVDYAESTGDKDGGASEYGEDDVLGAVRPVSAPPVLGASEGAHAFTPSSYSDGFGTFEAFDAESAEEGAEAIGIMDRTNVDTMLEKSIKPSTMSKYSRAWDKWVSFSTYHVIAAIPSNIRGLKIFLADTAELSGSVWVALLAAAAVAHFCALEGYLSPFERPRFGKIMRGIRNSYIKPVKPKKPFMREHIVKFMDHARSGTLVDWRAALPMALCFQHLLRGAEAFDLHGGNISVYVGHFLIAVKTSKNHPEGFSFKLPIDPDRSHCVGTFLATTWSRWASRWATGGPSSRASCRRPGGS